MLLILDLPLYWKVASELSLSLEHNQYGRLSCLENLARRLEIADVNEVGRLSPTALGRYLVHPKNILSS